MSFLDEVRAAKPQRARCTISVLLDELPADLRPDVEAAIADSSIPAAAIIKALTVRGYNPSGQSTWHRHRRGDCSCG